MIALAVLPAALVAAAGSTAAPISAGAVAASRAAWAVPADADQLIVVSSPTYDPPAPGYLATLRTYSRANRWSPWRPVFPTWQAETGYGHLRDVRHEGDGATPTGIFGVGTTMYGVQPNPGGLHEAYHQLVCGDWWDEDPYSATYNQFVHVPCGVTPSFASWSEALWTEGGAYPYFADIRFNYDPTVSGSAAPGSGIFLHSWVGGATAGCVALPEADLLEVLRWLDPARHPVIEIGTDGEVDPVPPSPPAVAWSVARSPDHGYWMASSAGTVTAFGDAAHLAVPAIERSPVTAIAPSGSGRGYFVGTGDGEIFVSGDARWHGSPFHDGHHVAVAAIAPVPGGGGYDLLGSDGSVWSYGVARWHGSPRAQRVAGRAVGLALTPGALGYFVLEADGKVLAFGDARAEGSPATGPARIAGHAVGLVDAASSHGYWVAGSAGGVAAYGTARWLGSLAARHLGEPVVAITPYGDGYALYAAAASLPARPLAATYTAR